MVKKTFSTTKADFYRASYFLGHAIYYLDFAVENKNRFTLFGGVYYEWMFWQAINDIKALERKN